MNYHKLLQKQLKKHLPESLKDDPELEKLLEVINDSYNAYERDKDLMGRAFSISEEEYSEINDKLIHELEVKRQSVEKLKEAIGTIAGEDRNNSDDLLIIARYLNKQVNERKNAELVFNTLIGNLPSAILLEDETRHIVFANQQFCDMFNIPATPESLRGTDCSNSAELSKHLFREPELFVSSIKKLLSRKKLVLAEEFELSNGKIYQRDYIPIFLEKIYKGHLWSYTDITERKKSQIAIEKSELTNRLIMNASLDAIVIINDQSEITFWNPQAEKIFGWKDTEVLGKKLIETIIPGQYSEAHERGMTKFNKTGKGPILNKMIELTAVNKYEKEFPVEISIIPVKQEEKTFFCSFIRDISERKKAELELKKSQDIWQFALEGAGDGVWEYDFESREAFFSRQYKKMLGYDDEEFKNEPAEWMHRIHPDDLDIIIDTDKKYYANEISSHQREYRIKHKDGHYLWILDRGMVLNYSRTGKPKRIIGTHTDITERKKTEEEYRRISVVASANEHGVLFTDAKGKIFWTNEGFMNITGYSKEEIIGRTPLQLCKGPLSKTESLETMVSSFYDGRSFNVEVIHYRKDQTWFWGRVKGQATYDQDGNVLQYFAIVENISHEKEQEEQFRSLAENIPGILYRYEFKANGEEGFAYISPDCEKKIGITSDELKNFDNIIHPDDRERELALNQKSKAERIPYNFEGRFIVPGKPLLWLNISSSYTHTNADGTSVNMGIIINTTKEKEVEVALSNREEKYRGIIANMHLGLLEVDNEEIIQFANQSFCEMCGYSLDELIGVKASKLFVRGEHHELMEVKNEQRKKGISDAYEISIKNKRGEAKWWLISGAARYNDKGELIGSIGIHLDITEQKQIELELIEAREHAETSTTAKQSFLAKMSHEIRTPMNAILGMSRQLQKTSLNDQQNFYLRTINTATENLLVIINDILDTSKIEAGKLKLEHIGFKLRDIIDKAKQVMQHRSEEKGLMLKSDVDERIADIFLGDPFRLNQVLLNLLSNAIKFSERGSVLIDCILVKDKTQEQVVQIKVKDNGIGMDKGFLENLFQSFSQEESSTSRKYGGTGLGMTITKQLLELMGGNIVVESEKNMGTTMILTIPFVKGVEQDLIKQEQKKSDSSLLAGKKILLVEDNEMNRIVVTTTLEFYGTVITEVENGLEAIEALKNGRYDLVLMDVQMPLMNGFEATAAIRKELKSEIPVIALTANAIKGENDLCIDAGMNDYISKPFEEEDLVNMMAKWLSLKEAKDKENKQFIPEQLYDLSKLYEISRGNEIFIQKMLTLFIEHVPISLSEMHEAYKQNDFAKIKSTAHRIKPTIDNMGIHSLKKEIREIEALAMENKHSVRLATLIRELDTKLNLVVKSLQN